MRNCELMRKTKETDVYLALNLDGKKGGEINTPVGFFNHMLELFRSHSGFDFTVIASGDVQVDFHHITEDIGILFGQAFNNCLKDKKGIARYASIALPMDESLVLASVDISGRPYLAYDVQYPTPAINNFDMQLIEEFLYAFTSNAKITLHIKKISGTNSHHIAEAVFKSLAYVLKKAVSIDKNNIDDIPSTKGVL